MAVENRPEGDHYTCAAPHTAIISAYGILQVIGVRIEGRGRKWNLGI